VFEKSRREPGSEGEGAEGVERTFAVCKKRIRIRRGRRGSKFKQPRKTEDEGGLKLGLGKKDEVWKNPETWPTPKKKKEYLQRKLGALGDKKIPSLKKESYSEDRRRSKKAKRQHRATKKRSIEQKLKTHPKGFNCRKKNRSRPRAPPKGT